MNWQVNVKKNARIEYMIFHPIEVCQKVIFGPQPEFIGLKIRGH